MSENENKYFRAYVYWVIVIILVSVIVIAIWTIFNYYYYEPKDPIDELRSLRAYGQPVLHGFFYGNGSLYQVDYDDSVKICFATPELMAKFLDQNPVGKFNITVPCPEKSFKGQEDQSGK